MKKIIASIFLTMKATILDTHGECETNISYNEALTLGIPSESDNALATFLDVAVIRCLFISHWGEDGVFWALMFFNRR
jgi:hypothetical protein